MRIIFKIVFVFVALAPITWLAIEREYVKKLIFKSDNNNNKISIESYTKHIDNPKIEHLQTEVLNTEFFDARPLGEDNFASSPMLPIPLKSEPSEEEILKDNDNRSVEDDQKLASKQLEQNIPINKYQTESPVSCKTAFISLNNIFIKFFQKQDFNSDVSLLQNLHQIPGDIYARINQIKELHGKAKGRNIVKNKIAAKMLYIEKVSYHEREFLNSMSEIQEYFYSPNFLSNCKS